MQDPESDAFTFDLVLDEGIKGILVRKDISDKQFELSLDVSKPWPSAGKYLARLMLTDELGASREYEIAFWVDCQQENTVKSFD